MQSSHMNSRNAKCAGWWYPLAKTTHNFPDNPASSAVISPHAGFDFSGMLSLEAVSFVKKNRVWIFGTSHYERIEKGISIFRGDYKSSIGEAVFPGDTVPALQKYYSVKGHRTDEHSIENVLYSLNHFTMRGPAFCTLVQIEEKEQFEQISDDIASAWMPGDSIIVSTDWNHFVTIDVIDRLMDRVSAYLSEGDIQTLFNECSSGKLEACGIDSLYLTSMILEKAGEPVKFRVLKSTDSSVVTGRKLGDKCVGYIAAANKIS